MTEEQKKLIDDILVVKTTAIREFALREAAAECQIILDSAQSFGLTEVAFGADSCREVILALIGET